MRKWKFIQVEFCPFTYNPVQGRIRLIDSGTLQVSCNRTGERFADYVLQDPIMNDLASERFVNFSDAERWYGGHAGSRSSIGYVIVTKNDVVAGSTKLDDFVTHKIDLGFSVQLITEDDYGSLSAPPPNGTADKIRLWLQNHYQSDGIEYV